MCAQRRTRYSEEFKKNAVKQSEEPKKTVKEIAVELGIDLNQLYRWRQTYLSNDVEQIEVSDDRSRLKDKKRIIELEERLKEVEAERDILKKAMMVFGKNQFEQELGSGF